MKERPILFSSDMVRAILAGRKTMTRRICKDQTAREYPSYIPINCPYGQPGDRLWVKETWANINKPGFPTEIIYRADDDQMDPANDAPGEFENDGGKWTPSLFMPRWASRITLEILSVRVERLQEISEEDAKAEGCSAMCGSGSSSKYAYHPAFQLLWDSINGKKYPWGSNPWVWVISFKWNELSEVR